MTRCAECLTNDVACAFDVSVQDLMQRDRRPHIAHARHALYCLMQQSGLSTGQIGRMVGHRDHSTVISGIDRAKGLLANDADFAARYERAAA